MLKKDEFRNVPFGYATNPMDEGALVPVARELMGLSHIVPMIAKHEISAAFGAEWLTSYTGRRISRQGLQKLIKTRYTDEDIARMGDESRELPD